MKFEQTGTGWRIEFLADGVRPVLRKQLLFTDPDKITDFAEQGGMDSTLASRQALEHGIRTGRGGVYLNLTDEQFERIW